jgi:dTDP-4-amino-4,6-dideoxygalactose transaminase
MINVTKTYLPPFENYTSVLKEAYDAGWVTNNGVLLQRLEEELKNYLGVKHLFICTNGTVTLQLALKALNVTGSVITTPFSYVATANSILWEKCRPVFADINAETFCLDAREVESKISSDTKAILATHVYGLPCEIELLDSISKKWNIPIIYDAAHAFGSEYNGRSLLSYGDISSCSFHATKLFHTGEGGCLVTDNDELARKIYLYRQFGHVYDDYYSEGINAKNSEFHAAMGLCVLKDLDRIIEKRKLISSTYDRLLNNKDIKVLRYNDLHKPNYSYYPVVFKSESTLLKVKSVLEAKAIFPRRYFFPSLNTLPFIAYQSCPISEDLSRRVICLPLYYELTIAEVEMICNIVIENL